MQQPPPLLTGRRRARKTFWTLLAALGGYLAYACVAVPFIEPSAAAKKHNFPSISIWSSHAFEELFPPGSWETERPKVLETNHGTLLFDEYQQSQDGKRLHLARCTFVYSRPNESSRPLILRAHEGATLFFDPPLVITRLEFGRLVGGKLTGRVTVDGNESELGKGDRVHIDTRDIEIESERIWTPHEVDFRYGPHVGRGSNLSIYLDDTTGPADAKKGRPQIGQITRLELLRVERIQVELERGLFPPTLDSASPAARQVGPRSKSKIEMRCQGPFRFDFRSLVGSLEDTVDIAHHAPDGSLDQLQSDLLELHLQPAPEDKGDATGERLQPPTNPQPQKLVAVGSPVLIQAPSHGLVARAQRIEYDVFRQSLRMTDRKRLTLVHQAYSITAPEVRYEFQESEKLGTFWAAGPGELTGHTESDEFVVNWEQEVRMDSAEDGAKVVHVKGARRVEVGGSGHLSADDLYLYLVEQANSADAESQTIQIDRLQAIGNVTADFPRFSAELGVARVWFQRQQQTVDPGPTQEVPNSTAVAIPLAMNSDSPQAVRRFHLEADQLHAMVRLADEPLVERVDVVGDVRLDELPKNKPNAVFLRGEQFKLVDGGTANPTAWLIGQPARGSLGSLQFVGSHIEVQQGRNQVRIDGPGRVKAVALDDSEDVPPITVDWSGGMRLDGQVIRFSDQVKVQGSRLTKDGKRSRIEAHGDELDVTLSRSVSLHQADSGPKVDLRMLAFRGWASIDHEQLGERGTRESSDQMRLRDLHFNRETGEVFGAGPGWVIHRGRPEQGRFGMTNTTPRTGLDFLRIDFARHLAGNVQLDDSLQGSEIVFQDDVRCLFGAIPDWESEIDYQGREVLGEQDAFLTSDILQIVDLPAASTAKQSVEIRAEGNFTIVGKTFTGSGHRLTYAKGKDQLILQGEGRSAGRIAYQQAAGARPVEMIFDKLYYYPKTRTHRGIGITLIEAPLDSVNLRSTLPFPGATR